MHDFSATKSRQLKTSNVKGYPFLLHLSLLCLTSLSFKYFEGVDNYSF